MLSPVSNQAMLTTQEVMLHFNRTVNVMASQLDQMHAEWTVLSTHAHETLSDTQQFMISVETKLDRIIVVVSVCAFGTLFWVCCCALRVLVYNKPMNVG